MKLILEILDLAGSAAGHVFSWFPCILLAVSFGDFLGEEM